MQPASEYCARDPHVRRAAPAPDAPDQKNPLKSFRFLHTPYNAVSRWTGLFSFIIKYLRHASDYLPNSCYQPFHALGGIVIDAADRLESGGHDAAGKNMC
jgi:hypothetical protein